MKLKALFFDLDGTLVNTAPDMVATINRMLTKRNKATVDFATAANQVSNGANALIKLGFHDTKLDSNALEDLRQEFLTDYAEHICEESHLYDGMQTILDLCKDNQVHWGVVTNKPYGLSKQLLQSLGIYPQCSTLLGGDSLPVAKPDPRPLLHCTYTLNLAASECLYIGDHERDIIAGNAAGMDTAVAQWGYIDNDTNTESWGARYLIGQPQGLQKLLTELIA